MFTESQVLCMGDFIEFLQKHDVVVALSIATFYR